MKKTLILLLLAVLILGCVDVDMSPRVNLTKTNISYNLSQKSEINQSVNLTSANTTTQSNNISSVNTSIKASNITTPLINVTSNITPQTSDIKLQTSADFEIFFPRGNYKAKGDLIAVSLKLINFSIGTLGDAEKPNVGLFKYYVDNSESFKISDKATFTVSNLTKGKRTLTIEMIGTNMTNYGVKKSVAFQAQAVTEGY